MREFLGSVAAGGLGGIIVVLVRHVVLTRQMRRSYGFAQPAPAAEQPKKSYVDRINRAGKRPCGAHLLGISVGEPVRCTLPEGHLPPATHEWQAPGKNAKWSCTEGVIHIHELNMDPF